MYKYFGIAFLTIFLFSACNPENMELMIDEMSGEKQPMVDPDGEIDTEFTGFIRGDFVSDAHSTSGTASINASKTVLTFTDFNTDDGPKLLVYLSTDKHSTDFVDLGDLKGISGDFDYDIPSDTDLGKYNVVSIWCVDFLVSFGHAKLK